ncbi:MAG: DEAD/DEAH box helicase [Nocardioidaceae bacterium]
MNAQGPAGETTDPSPAERYAQSRQRAQYPHLADFRGEHAFALDGFQVRGCEVLESGRSVLVAAPTGAGKTVVGEFAAHLALATGDTCFYTTPIKALSNQKYAELVQRHGPEQVGLLTGDNAINSEAPIVVMTTEVLRNMLYAGSRSLNDLRYVVLDEVHYLADRSRGAVWEEVIIHLPDSVSIAALSATVSNAEEFGEWLETVRGETVTIVEETRPVPLYQHVVVGRRLLDLFADDDAHESPDQQKVNPELQRVARDDWASRQMRDRRTPRSGRGQTNRGQSNRGRNVGNGRRVWVPSRVEVVELLDRQGLLPAIVFIFSRAGCEAAVQQCLSSRLRLTTPEQRDEIVKIVEARCRELAPADLDALGYYDFLDGLSRGIAAHHAGMLPTFKECVEELFALGLCKVVFATETLALGVNMPARSVVLEKLSKWNGETHADITPGEYTQLTGRAGRRGIDVEGHGVVLWQQGMDPKSVAGLASTRTYPLKSSFRPTYNMSVNLVAQSGRERARQLLESSFAQFQADRAVVGLARQLRKSDEALAGYAEAMVCSQGDFTEYAALRNSLKEAEKTGAKRRRLDQRDAVIDSLLGLKRGDVIMVPSGRFAGYAVVIDPDSGGERDGPRPYVLTMERQARRLSLVDFQTPVEALTKMRVPKSFNGRNPGSRRDLASALRQRTKTLVPVEARRVHRARDSGEQGEIDELRMRLRQHPCHSCVDREDHARWAERWHKLNRDAETIRLRIERRTNTIARRFDRICEVLLSLGYLQAHQGELQVSPNGKSLMRIYTDLDLLIAESLRNKSWSTLDAPSLAAVLSTLVYQARKPEGDSPAHLPTGQLRMVLEGLSELADNLLDLERQHDLAQLRQPDLGLVAAIYQWSRGAELEEVLDLCDLAAGDFVRWVKQIVDLAGQVAQASPDKQMRAVCNDLITSVRRGVVAYSSMVD